MRGRVDLSEGLIRERPTYQTTPNLIQKPDYNTALIKTFRVLERSPTPTLGDVIHPVCVVEDLRESIRGAQVRTVAGMRAIVAVGTFPVLYVRCSPNGPTLLSNLQPTDPPRLIVERVIVQTSASVNDLTFAPSIHIEDEGFQAFMAGEGGSSIAAGAPRRGGVFPMTAQPTSGFTSSRGSASATGPASLASGGNIFKCNAAEALYFEGPFELPPDFICSVSKAAAAGAAFELHATFFCREYPQ